MPISFPQSAFPPKADIRPRDLDLLWAASGLMHRSKEHPYSITLSIARHLPMMPGS